MPSSVTIPDHLRRKLKRLAAELDTSQADIISRAIEKFESYNNLTKEFQDPNVIITLKSISDQVHERNSGRKRRSYILMKSRSYLDDISPALWSRPIED